MKEKLSLVLFVLLVLVGAVAVVGWKRAGSLEVKLQALVNRVSEWERPTAGTRAPTEQAAMDLQAKAQKELILLRNEVTQLRASAQTASRIEAENTKLRRELQPLPSTPANGAGKPDRFARDEWALSGSATPEAALVSALWAMKEGQVDKYLELLPPADQEKSRGRSHEEIAAELRQKVMDVSGVRILETEQVSPSERTIRVYMEGPGRLENFRMTQVGEEWKFGDTGPAYDPLAFYRRNPELMKRYFPHLLRASTNKPGAAR